MAKNRYDFLRKLLTDQEGKVLVIGCGSRDEMSILNHKCKGVGLDISRTAVEKSRNAYPQYDYVVGDAMNMPFKKGDFNCVVCSEVIEHLPNEEKFIESVNDILKPGGRFVLTTPNWLNWYGMARFLGEAITRKPVTSANQPIDRWTNYWKLKNNLGSYFEIKNKWGLWFFPPFGRGRYMIPEQMIFPIVKALNPINKLLRKVFFPFGHMLALDLKKRK
jgi:SAM-dependent methyltransferase